MEPSSNSSLPDGVVTFFFTDIEGSTRLLEQFGESFHEQLEIHSSLVRDVIESHEGTVVGTEGDSFFAVFTNPVDGLEAAIAVQRRLSEHEWPQGGEIKVRIGIHTGLAVKGGEDYLGIDVNRAARISAAGSGGQILCSEATASLVGRRLPHSTDLIDLGKHRLKDLSDPQVIFQLVAPGLDHDFPPLRTLEAIPNNLPLQLTTFIGRRDLVRGIADMLRRERILTLTGPGGTGKTRLSLQVGAEVSGDFPNGVFFVPLASVSDPELVASEILDSLGLVPGNSSPADQLASELSDKRLLLILDNFEQILGAAPLVATLGRAAPNAKFLTTSRAPLAISGEQEMPIPPLAVPLSDAASTDTLANYEAVRLFVDRAKLVDPRFELTSTNALHVAKLVEQVDGLPLAIELLASRVKVLTPEELLRRYEARGLTTSKRDLPERQRSVWGAIDWSHQLLTDSEQKLFRRMGVFNGGALLDEIEEVCGDDGEDLVEALSVLVDHSLVRRISDPEGRRFAMLHVIREYALEKLGESEDFAEVPERHAATYLELAERAAKEILGTARKAWLSRLDDEHDNLRSALADRYHANDAESAMRLVFATWRFMQARGHLHEASMRLDEVLGMSREPNIYRAKALEAAGGVAWWRGDLEKSTHLYREAYEICESLDQPRELANSLYNLGLAGGFSQTMERSEWMAILDRSQQIYESLDDKAGLGDVYWGRANLELNRGGAQLEVTRGLLEQAASFYREAGNQFGLGWTNFELGDHARRLGEFESAEQRLREGLTVFDEQGDLSGVVLFLASLSAVAFAVGDMERAHRLSGAVTTIRLSTGTDLVVAEPNVVEGLEYERLEALTGEAAIPYREGREMTTVEAVRYALS